MRFLICAGLLVAVVGATEDEGAGARSVNRPVLRSELPIWTQMDAGHVRCFCNLPACISTMYMCKSSGGGCFSDLRYHSSAQSIYRGRHGCMELLPETEQKDWCQRNPKDNRRKGHPRSQVHCCYHDMCNHVDDPQTRTLLLNDTSAGEPNEMTNGRVVESHLNSGYNADVWFKAATIAVPICGAVILFALIALAVRLLRTESHHNPNYKLGCNYQPPHGKSHYSKHAEHYHNAQNLLPIPHNSTAYSNHDIRRYNYSPIIIQKDVNTRNANRTNYNLLPKAPHTYEVHKCYENNGAGEVCKNINVDRSPKLSNTNKNYAKDKFSEDV